MGKSTGGGKPPGTTFDSELAALKEQKALVKPSEFSKGCFLCRYFWLVKRQIPIFAQPTIYRTITYGTSWQ